LTDLRSGSSNSASLAKAVEALHNKTAAVAKKPRNPSFVVKTQHFLRVSTVFLLYLKSLINLLTGFFFEKEEK
jgi:hypothetical protein